MLVLRIPGMLCTDKTLGLPLSCLHPFLPYWKIPTTLPVPRASVFLFLPALQAASVPLVPRSTAMHCTVHYRRLGLVVIRYPPHVNVLAHMHIHNPTHSFTHALSSFRAHSGSVMHMPTTLPHYATPVHAMCHVARSTLVMPITVHVYS